MKQKLIKGMDIISCAIKLFLKDKDFKFPAVSDWIKK